jgi:hypothetical protein
MKKHDNRNRQTKDFGAGMGKVTFTVPLGGYITEMRLALRGAVSVAGGAQNGNAKAENPLGLIQRVIVEAVKRDGSRYPDGKIKDVSPRSQVRRRAVDKGKVLADIISPNGITGAIAVTNLHSEIVLRFALPTLKKPIDTALNTNEYKSITVTVETGGRDTLFVGNDRAFDLSGLKLDYSDRREDMGGDCHVLFEQDVLVQINAANDRFMLSPYLPAGGNYLDLFLMAQNGAQNTLADTIVDKVRIDGSSIEYEKSDDDIKQEQFEFVDAGQAVAGLYYVPFSPDGLLYGAVPVNTPQDLDAKLSLLNPGGAGADSVLVNVRRVYWPENYRAA